MPVRILLIEDHIPDVFLIEEALRAQKLEFEMSHCADGEEALSWLAAMDPDRAPQLIVLDLNLPKVNGFAVLRAIRQQPRFDSVPVAVLTSSQSPADRKRAAESGADAFIVKPPHLDEFREDVGSALAGALGYRRGAAGRHLALLCLRVPIAGLLARRAQRARRRS
ncbi:MAG TPA: response regulator [Bryobacteraceae bacterium]|nr:response regulator [Bryobacteraceae bacterium]